MSAKTAGTDSVGTSDTVLFDSSISGSPCRRWFIATDAAVNVHVSGLHSAGDYVPLSVGETVTFLGSITKVIAKTTTGTATVRHGVIAA